jgi:hypothetical protein
MILSSGPSLYQYENPGWLPLRNSASTCDREGPRSGKDEVRGCSNMLPGFADGVRHDRPTGPEGFITLDRGIARRLMLNLRVELGSEQDDD